MAGVRQVQVTFDCAAPRAVAEFWKATPGYVDSPVPPGFETRDDFDRSLPVEQQGSSWICQEPAGAGPRLFFQRVPEGKTVKNRLLLDVRIGVGLTGDERVAALEAEAHRLTPLGARRLHLLPADDGNEACLVMQDVEATSSIWTDAVRLRSTTVVADATVSTRRRTSLNRLGPLHLIA